MEIDEQTDRRIEQLHVTEELCFVDRQDRLYRFQFDQKAIVDVEVNRQGSEKTQPLYSIWTSS